MFTHILVPLDGSHLSETALPVAISISEAFKASVTLLHVIELDAPAEIHRDRHLTTAQDAEEYLAGVARRWFPEKKKVDWHVHAAAVSDVPGSIVEHTTGEFDHDLIILTSHGNSGTHDLFFGNIAQQVATDSGIPVLLIKPAEINPAFKVRNILVPLDNESVHDQALVPARELAKAYGAELDLICVIPTFGTLSGEQAAAGQMMPATTAAYLDITEDIAREHFQAHLDDFQKEGIPSSAEIARGDPAAMILKTAEARHADLIIFGTHGRAGLDAFWNRSIAAGVARRTAIPVLLVPLPAGS